MIFCSMHFSDTLRRTNATLMLIDMTLQNLIASNQSAKEMSIQSDICQIGRNQQDFREINELMEANVHQAASPEDGEFEQLYYEASRLLSPIESKDDGVCFRCFRPRGAFCQ